MGGGEDLLVRRSLTVPDDDRELRVGLTLVRDAEVFLNGEPITGGMSATTICPFRDNPLVRPRRRHHPWRLNVIAIRARAPASSDPRFPAPAIFDAEIRLVTGPPTTTERTR